MISSISSNRLATWQTDYSQRQSVAPTNELDKEAKQDPALKPADAKATDTKKTGGLSASDLKIVSELKQRDAEVRAHEAAHLAAAGSIAKGGASFNYQQGPDGIQYAIGGEVSIDTSAIPGDPAATLRKADTIRRAALAPAQPSGPDIQAAASATAMAAQAQAELLQKNQDTQNGNKEHRGTKIDVSA
ncbi:MAG: hypothetical protein EPN17_06785 [Methylobacter sp.]|nr:MAG: hypothetical protein EPN17_06785 [Methylobacter sp.]